MAERRQKQSILRTSSPLSFRCQQSYEPTRKANKDSAHELTRRKFPGTVRSSEETERSIAARPIFEQNPIITDVVSRIAASGSRREQQSQFAFLHGEPTVPSPIHHDWLAQFQQLSTVATTAAAAATKTAATAAAAEWLPGPRSRPG